MSFSSFKFLKNFFRFTQLISIYKKKNQEKRSKNRGRSARLLLYTPTDSGSLGGQPGSYCIPQPTLVRWVVSQAPIVYSNRLWFVGWSARLLMYTSTISGSLGGQPGCYCIPQPTLVCWVVSQAPIIYPNRPWFAGWSAMLLLYTPTNPGSFYKIAPSISSTGWP